MSDRSFFSALILIVFMAFVVRLSMVDHHLPDGIVTDEGSDLSVAVRLLDGEVPNRHVRYHRSLIAFHNLVAVGAVSVKVFLSGQASNVQELQDYYFANRHEFTLATRVLMSALTSLAIFIVGLTGRYFSPLVGLSAASVLALNGFVTLNSTYALPDALVILPTVLVIYFSVRIAEYQRLRDYIGAGLAIALVMLAKMNGALVAIAALLAHLIICYRSSSTWRQFIRFAAINKKPWALLAAVVVGNILFNPLPYFYPDDFIFELRRLYDMFFGGSTVEMDTGTTLSIYLASFNELNLLIMRSSMVFFVIAFAVGWLNRWSLLRWVILLTGLLLFVFILRSLLGSTSKIYYWTPFVVVASLISGMAVAWIIEKALEKKGVYRLLLVPVVLLIISEALYSAYLIRLVRADSTEQIAQAFIYDAIPPDEALITPNVLIYGIPLQRNAQSIERAREWGMAPLAQWDHWLSQPENERRQPAYNVYSWELFSQIDTWDDLARIIRDQNIRYYVVMDYCQGASHQPDDTSTLDFPPVNHTWLQQWEPVAAFSPFTSDLVTDDTQCADAIEIRTGLSKRNGIFQQYRTGPIFTVYHIPDDWRPEVMIR